MKSDHAKIRVSVIRSHLEFAEERGFGKTYCPSEVARSIFPNGWREQMDLVRQVADELVASGHLVTLQKGKIIDQKLTEAKGPIRLRKTK